MEVTFQECCKRPTPEKPGTSDVGLPFVDGVSA